MTSPSTKISDITAALEQVAPLSYAEQWDNVGLLVGSPAWTTASVMLTIDLTDAVLSEAIDAKVGCIVAYHPLIFRPVKSFTNAERSTRLALEAARAGIAVYCPHTALDAAPGGVNDWLAGLLGEGTATALTPHAALPRSQQCKLVTFCPADAADAIRDALAQAGAGRIGDYDHCSFRTPGQGTFRGGAGTNPHLGAAGTLESVEEVRLEMVCAQADLGGAVAALRRSHPYEEPPVEVHALQPRPDPAIGAGRLVVLAQKLALTVVVDRLKRGLDVKHLAVAVGGNPRRRYQRVGLCAGAGGGLLEAALAAECELFLTGEMRHHDVLAAQAAACTVVLAGHTNTERGYLKPLAARLAHLLPDLPITISKKDTHPLRTM